MMSPSTESSTWFVEDETLLQPMRVSEPHGPLKIPIAGLLSVPRLLTAPDTLT